MNPIIAAILLLGPNGSVDVRLEKLQGKDSLTFGGSAFHKTSAKITDLRTIAPGGSVKVFLWDEVSPKGTSHFSAISLRSSKIDTVVETSNQLKLRYGSFDPLVSVLPVQNRLKASPAGGMFVVQFVSQPLEEYREAIRNLGGEVENYLPDNAYVIEISPDKVKDLKALPFVRWVGAFEPGWRLDQSLIRGLELGTLKEDSYYLQIAGDSAARKARVAAQIVLQGGVVVDSPSQGTLMEIRLTPDALTRAAAIDGVLFIDVKGTPQPDMDNVRVVTGANTLQTVAGYQGQGVRAHVIDGGMRATHVDNVGHVTVRTNSGDTSHGTSTTGIVWGNGTGNAAGKGMLPMAHGVFSIYSTGWSGAARLAWTQDTVNVHNCVVESNSWGDNLTNQYTTISSYMDEIVFKTDLSILNSMSNWGDNLNVRPQAWAKNVVSIGGVYHLNNTNTADDNWNNGASIGPAADGRMKPELCYYYDSIFCPTNTSNTAYTAGFNGTSSATPMSAGCFGLMYQMWGDGLFGNTCLGGSVFANRMHSSTAKAMMVNRANTYSNTQTDIERFRQGWGLSNVQNIYDARNSMFVVDESDLLTNLATKDYRLYVAPGTPTFKATMAYTDYWAAANANPTRVNQLSIMVTAPDGTTYYGNNGMLGAIDAPNVTTPGGAPDTKNNLQNVWINNPASGVWTVRIKAENLVQDGHVETAGITDADYGLVVSGVQYSIVPSAITPYKPMCILSGGVPEATKSDNSYVLLRAPITAGAQQFIQSGVVATGTTSVLSPSSFNLVTESQTNLGNGRYKILFWNYQTSSYEQMSDTTSNTVEGAITVVGTGDLSRFVNQSTGEVKAAAYYEVDQTLPIPFPWASKLDHIRWFVNP